MNKKFLEWQNKMGMPQKQKDFAAYLGVKPTTYSGWVNGDIPPTGNNLQKLANKLGYEIYVITGVVPPSPIVKTLADIQAEYNALSPDQQQLFVERMNQLIEDTLIELGSRRIK